MTQKIPFCDLLRSSVDESDFLRVSQSVRHARMVSAHRRRPLDIKIALARRKLNGDTHDFVVTVFRAETPTIQRTTQRAAIEGRSAAFG